MARPSFSSLRVRLVLLVLLAVLPALGLVLYTAWDQHRHARAAVQRDALRLAELAATDHQLLVDGARQFLTALARVREVRERTPETCNPLLADLRARDPRYANLLVADPAGSVVCSAVPLAGAVNVADRAYFRQVLATRAFAVGEYQVGRVTGRATVSFGQPVLDRAGTVEAVVIAGLDLGWLNELAHRVTAPPGSTFTVVDRAGVILARYPDAQRWIGKPAADTPMIALVLTHGQGVAEMSGLDGVPRLFGFTRLEGGRDQSSAYVSVGIPTAAAYADVRRTLTWTVIGLAIAAGLVLLATRAFAARFILSRMDALVIATERLGKGDLDARTGLAQERGELGQLGRAFDRMAEALAGRQAETEQRRREAESLAEVGRVMLQSVNSEEIGQRITQRLRDLLGGASAALYRMEPGSEDLVAVATVGDQGPSDEPSIVFPKGTGAVGLALRLGTLISTPNLLTDARVHLTPEARTRIEQAAFRAVLVVPLQVRGRVVGALGVGDREGRIWTDGDTQLARAFADQAALALENARLYQRADERARRLSALSALTRAITSAVSGEDVYNAIARVPTTLLEAKATRVWLDDREARALRNHGSFGLDPERERTTTDFPVLPYGKGLVGHVFAAGTAEYLTDIQQDPRSLNQRLAREADLHAFAGLPLRAGDRPVGVLAILFGRRAAFTDEEKELMQLLADHAAIAITNAELFRREQESRVEAEASARVVRDNEERIRLIIETSLEAVITMDASGEITGWNPQAERVFGWARSEALGRSLAETIVPERDREAHRRGIQHFLATGTGPILNKRIEVTALHRSGREFPVELTISAAHVGSTVLFSGFVRDLTDVKRAERRQAVQFAVARELAEPTPLSEKVPPLLEAISTSTGWDLAELWTVEPEGQVLRWAGAWHIAGLEADEFEAISREMTLAPAADVPGRAWATEEPVWMTDALAGMHPTRASAAGPLGLRAALGVPVRGTTGVIALLTFFSRSPRPRDDDLDSVMDDIGGRIGQLIERERAQEALEQAEGHVRQLQRLEAVGRLAGGVAHDFNNLLTVIMGRGDILLGRLPADNPHRRDIALIKKTAERAAALTKQLLAFSRKQILEPKVLDLNTVVSGMVTMLQRLIGEDIELVFLAGSELGRVKADPGQLEQVVANLAVNARDAMPNGGRLTLETTAVDLGEHYARQHVGVQAGSYVMLGVSDTGTGMDRETQARIFDPFFTTKEPGKGTGLGLATVYGIVKQSGGNIWVYSELGKGTTFKVYLPQVHDAEDAAEPEQIRPGRGTETILIVEDEDEVRALACEVLATYGYEVLQARTPADALLIAERHTGPIHLLLTDVIMPGMSGRMLAERLAPLRPEMTVLYMSGYTDEAIVHHGTLDAGTPFIQKPFTPDALAAGVRRLLDAH
jgi:PAS domain S-box-containing protein